MGNSLQEQRDTEFADPEDMDLQQQVSAAIAEDSDEESQVQFADEADSYPAPPVLEDDGSEKPPVTDFADVNEGDVPAPTAAPSRAPSKTDIHAPEPQQQETDETDGDQPTFSNDLLGRAQQYGVNPQQATTLFGTPEKLEAALLFMDQQAMNNYQAAWQQQQQQQQYTAQQVQQQQAVNQPVVQQQPPPAAQQQQQQAVNQPAQQQQQQGQYQLKNEEEFDPMLTEDLQGMQNHLLSVIQQQQATVESLRQQAAYQQQAIEQWMQQQTYDRAVRDFEEFDTFVESLGDDWSDILGPGRSNELPQNSPQLINRQRLFETANTLRQIHAQQGRNVSLKAATPSALKMAFPDRNQTATTWRSPPRDQQGRFTARPAKRKQANGSKRENALRRWDKATADLTGPVGFEEEFRDGV